MRVDIISSGIGGMSVAEVVPISLPSFSWSDGSGFLAVPVVGDRVVLLESNGIWFPVTYFTPPIANNPDNVFNSPDENGILTKRPTTTGTPNEKPNLSAGRRLLTEGSRGILGSHGDSGILVDSSGLVKVFSSEICSIDFLPKTNEINVFCQNMKMSTSSYNMGCELSERRKGKTTTREEFFASTKKNAENYYLIETGHHFDNAELFRYETLKKPDGGLLGGFGIGGGVLGSIPLTPGSIVPSLKGDVRFDIIGDAKNFLSNSFDNIVQSGLDYVNNLIPDISGLIPNLPSFPGMPSLPSLPSIPQILGAPNMKVKQPFQIPPTKVGRQDSSIYSFSLSKKGEAVWDSEELFQFKTKKSFDVFSTEGFAINTEGECDIIAKKSIGVYSSEEAYFGGMKATYLNSSIDVNIFGGKNLNCVGMVAVNISSKTKLLLQNTAVAMEFMGAFVQVKKATAKPEGMV